VPAGVGHHVVDHPLGHRDDIVEVATGPQHLHERNLKTGFGNVMRMRHEGFLRRRQLLNSLRLQFGQRFVAAFQPDVRAHPGNDFAHRQRLGDVVDAARLESGYLHGQLFMAGGFAQ